MISLSFFMNFHFYIYCSMTICYDCITVGNIQFFGIANGSYSIKQFLNVVIWADAPLFANQTSLVAKPSTEHESISIYFTFILVLLTIYFTFILVLKTILSKMARFRANIILPVIFPDSFFYFRSNQSIRRS